MTDHPPVELPEETIQRYLTELARLGARYGIELRPDVETRSMRIVPISPDYGGYYARRLDDGPRVLLPYQHGHALDDPADVLGDDMHPSAREEQARCWLEDNAEALADERRAARLGDPFPAAFRSARGAVDPHRDLDIY